MPRIYKSIYPDCRPPAVVFAKSDLNEKGTRGISAFIVEAGWEGFSRGKTEEKMGMQRFRDFGLDFQQCEGAERESAGRGEEGL